MLPSTRAAFVVSGWLAAAAQAQEVVDWQDAAQCVGRVCGVRGTVAVSENDGATIRLYFDAERRDVQVLLMHGWLVTWPRYDGETIIATGKVDRFRDHIELILLDPSTITVLGGLPSPTPSVALPAPTASVPPPSPTNVASPASPTAPVPSPAGGEVEELRQRVRELEQRVRELEGR